MSGPSVMLRRTTAYNLRNGQNEFEGMGVIAGRRARFADLRRRVGLICRTRERNQGFRRSYQKRRWLIALVLCSVSGLGGCDIFVDKAEKVARKYGERLPDSELGPYADFTREQYFQHKCDTEAGEFIYKTVENVEGVFQMRLRDPKDLIDRLRKGDVPEDPWGHTNSDAQSPWKPFVAKYRFFETTKSLPNRGDRWKSNVFAKKPEYVESRYWRYRLGEPDGKSYLYQRFDERVTRPLTAEPIDKLKSRHGYIWREVRDKYDHHFGVWGGEFVVKDLQTDETLAVKRGFFDSRYAICPRDKDVFYTYDFVSKVLKAAAPRKTGETADE